MSTPPLLKSAKAFDLSLKTVSYSTYITYTQWYGAKEGLPNQYYDLTTLTHRLTSADYKRLAPVLANNALLYVNTQNPHYLDIGASTSYANWTKPTKPWGYIVNTELPKENGFQTGLDSFKPIRFTTKMVPYKGPDSAYRGRSVLQVAVEGIAVQDIRTPDLTNHNDPSMSQDGPQLNLYMLVDPATNEDLKVSITLAY